MRRLLLPCLFVLALPGTALAHVERTSYWPDPAPDTTVRPSAGGKVPKPRSLASALDLASATSVVCKGDSLTKASNAIAAARVKGYRLRPTEPLIKLSQKQAANLLSVNKRLFARCKFHDIQPAVTAARNNGRVVVMPGLYTEDPSRAVPALP